MAEPRRQARGGRPRQYGLWLRDRLPVPPRSTAHRMRANQRQRADQEDHNEVFVQANEQVENEAEDLEANDEREVEFRYTENEGEALLANRNTVNLQNPDDDNANDEREHCDDHEDEEYGDRHGPDIPNQQENIFVHGGKKFEELEEEVFLNGRRTKFEVLLLVWHFSFRYSLSMKATEDLCKLVNCMLGNNFIPTSKYMIREVFGSMNYSFHYFCPDCKCYIKEVVKSERKAVSEVECPVCHKLGDTSLLTGGNFFVTLPIKQQLVFFLEHKQDILELLQYRWNRPVVDDDSISDIFDGTVYKDHVNEGALAGRFSMSLSFCTDGAAVFKACKNTMWPIHFRLNELPPSCRFDQDNSLLAGVWFGKDDPDMSIFLSAFVNEVRDLYNNGIEWTAPSGELISSKVVLLAGLLDSKAKPIVQNIKQFNGYYGCGYCDHPGVVLDDGVTTCKYPMNDNPFMLNDLSFSYSVNGVDRVTKLDKVFNVTDRNNETARREGETAERLLAQRGMIGPGNIEDVNGVKGRGTLNALPFFDIVFGFPIDYMHGTLLGVVRSVNYLWFDSPVNREYPFSIKNRISDVDERLLNICPPSSISRRPRSIADRIHWHANEWRSWLLYYSLPCLNGVLPGRFLKHHGILVTVSHMLLSEKITAAQLETATWYLVEYVTEFQNLYGASQMFFNTHLLLHMGKMVKTMGPWWCYSLFSFESGNGCLLKLSNGVRGTANQIAEKYSRCRIIPSIISMYNVQEDILAYASDLMCYRRVPLTTRLDSITILGAQISVPLSEGERQAIVNAGHDPTSTTYERMIKDRIKYHARCYSRQGDKSNDSVARLVNSQYMSIDRILVLRIRAGRQRSVFILGRLLQIEGNESITAHPCGAKARHIKVGSQLFFGRYNIVRADLIAAKAILMSVGNESYITDFPNRFEKD